MSRSMIAVCLATLPALSLVTWRKYGGHIEVGLRSGTGTKTPELPSGAEDSSKEYQVVAWFPDRTTHPSLQRERNDYLSSPTRDAYWQRRVQNRT